MATAQVDTLLRHIHKLAANRPKQQWSDRQLLDDFSARREEGAFAALVARHGPMVLRVCRRVLHHEQDAEDAFQATFLVLARNTESIRKREAVADWLHGVAYRTAMKAKRSAARRRAHEARLRDRRTDFKSVPPTWDDVQAVLDEEIQRLREPFRTAFVLCVLESKSGPEAAAELGCKEGTVSSRLVRARRLLQQRLARRGIKLAALLAALSISDSAVQAGVPASLAHVTLRSGLLVAAGSSAAAVIPSHVAALAAGVTRAMFLTRAKIAVIALFALGLFAASAGVLAHQSQDPKKEPPLAAKDAKPQTPKANEDAKSKAPATKDENKDTVEVTGRVFDPAGKPVREAKVYVVHHHPYLAELPADFARLRARTDTDGRFRFRVSKTKHPQSEENQSSFYATMTAVADGYGPGWATVYELKQLADLTMKLVKDDVPINGRVIDLQGKAIKGVTVRVLMVTAMVEEDLQPWLDDLKKSKGENPIYRHQSGGLLAAVSGLTKSVKTDADGKFRLTGIGRERIAVLRIESPTIETVDVNVMTRAGRSITVPNDRNRPQGSLVYHGATFDHAAAPTVPIFGIVRDKDTREPLAGVTIQSRIASALYLPDRQYLRTTTDAKGNYRLVGLPKHAAPPLYGEARRGGHVIQVVPPAGKPYLPSVKETSTTTGLDPLQMDFELKRGIEIRGRVTDKATGKPVQAQVDYFAFTTNPHLREAPGFRGSGHVSAFTAKDGSFKLVGLPGPGIIAAKAGRTNVFGSPDEGRYVAGSGADEIKGPRQGSHFTTDPFICAAPLYHTLVGIDPDKTVKSITCDVQLDPGKTVTGKVVGPDGKAVAGVQLTSVWGVSRHQNLKTAEFTVHAIDPKRPQPFFFHQKDKQLGAAVLLKGDEPKDFTVRLQPCATITGRIVDEDGQPVAGMRISGFIAPGQLNIAEGWGGHFADETDKNGRFEIQGVIPGLKVSAYMYKAAMVTGQLFKVQTFKPGEKKDLGDVEFKKLQ
jgi:RNA polymerase sigma factor (sigma-70 family)